MWINRDSMVRAWLLGCLCARAKSGPVVQAVPGTPGWVVLLSHPQSVKPSVWHLCSLMPVVPVSGRVGGS